MRKRSRAAFWCFCILLLFLFGTDAPAQAQAPSNPPTPDLPLVTRTVAPARSPDAIKADYIAIGKDDDRLINEAIRSLPVGGGRIVLYEGAYTLSGAIVLLSNVRLVGNGKGPQLYVAANSNSAAIVNSDPLNGNKGITVENIRIAGNKAGQLAGSGLHLRRVTESTLSNLEVVGARNSGIDILAGSNGNTLRDIRVSENGHNGLVISESHDNKVSNVTAENNGNGGVWIFHGEQNSLSYIYAHRNSYSGLEIQASNNILSNVVSSNNAQGGVYLTQASGNYIHGVAHRNASSGFALNASAGNTLQVWAEGNGRHGIDLYSSSLNLILGSLARNNGSNGRGFDGIHISDDGKTPSNYNMILSSYAWDDQPVKTQEFGIKIVGMADYNIMIGNMLKDNKFGPIIAEKRHNIMEDNVPAMP